jgi:hypothetical protein
MSEIGSKLASADERIDHKFTKLLHEFQLKDERWESKFDILLLEVRNHFNVLEKDSTWIKGLMWGVFFLLLGLLFKHWFTLKALVWVITLGLFPEWEV